MLLLLKENHSYSRCSVLKSIPPAEPMLRNLKWINIYLVKVKISQITIVQSPIGKIPQKFHCTSLGTGGGGGGGR